MFTIRVKISKLNSRGQKKWEEIKDFTNRQEAIDFIEGYKAEPIPYRLKKGATYYERETL